MSDLIAEVAFQNNSHQDKEKSTDGASDDPGQSMLAITWQKGQRRGEKDDDPYHDMNPRGVSINGDSWEKQRQEGHHDTVDNAGR